MVTDDEFSQFTGLYTRFKSMTGQDSTAAAVLVGAVVVYRGLRSLGQDVEALGRSVKHREK